VLLSAEIKEQHPRSSQDAARSCGEGAAGVGLKQGQGGWPGCHDRRWQGAGSKDHPDRGTGGYGIRGIAHPRLRGRGWKWSMGRKGAATNQQPSNKVYKCGLVQQRGKQRLGVGLGQRTLQRCVACKLARATGLNHGHTVDMGCRPLQVQAVVWLRVHARQHGAATRLSKGSSAVQGSSKVFGWPSDVAKRGCRCSPKRLWHHTTCGTHATSVCCRGQQQGHSTKSMCTETLRGIMCTEHFRGGRAWNTSEEDAHGTRHIVGNT